MGDPVASFGTLQSERQTQRVTRPSCLRGPLQASENWVLWTGSDHINTHRYLSLQPLLIIVEEAEAVEFVQWRRVAGLTAPAACFMSGFRPRRWSLTQTNTNALRIPRTDTINILLCYWCELYSHPDRRPGSAANKLVCTTCHLTKSKGKSLSCCSEQPYL